ncbi:MAG TPA: carbohydrate kinase, partial [Candidatus Binatia bacterium]|nr:carbohydrate kinase [Candidatus Binatia bacterium]
DVLGVPVVVPTQRETAVLGAAMLGAVAVGIHRDLPSAIRSMVRYDHRLEPDPVTKAAYDDAFARYLELWPALAPVTHRLSGAVPAP